MLCGCCTQADRSNLQLRPRSEEHGHIAVLHSVQLTLRPHQHPDLLLPAHNLSSSTSAYYIMCRGLQARARRAPFWACWAWCCMPRAPPQLLTRPA